VSATADPRDLLREAVAAQRARTGSVKAAVAAVARLVGMKPRRIEAVWWGEPTRLDWEEAERIRAAAARQWQRDIAEAEARAALLRARLSAMEGTLHATMADDAVQDALPAGAGVLVHG
jgi:hypothetical protein